MKAQSFMIGVIIFVIVSVSALVGIVMYTEHIGPFSTTTTSITTSSTIASTSTTSTMSSTTTSTSTTSSTSTADASTTITITSTSSTSSTTTTTILPKTFSIDSEGFILRKGERFFPIGLFAGPNPEWFSELENAKFNVFHRYGKNITWYTDELKNQGRKIYHLGPFSPEFATNLANHPNFFGYYLCDEPEWDVFDVDYTKSEYLEAANEKAEELKKLTAEFHELDPNHLTFITINADYVYKHQEEKKTFVYPIFKDSSDVLMIDHYPYRNETPKNTPPIGLASKIESAKEVMGNKPIMIILQAHGSYADPDGDGPCKAVDGFDYKLREPTYEEGLNMVYLSLVHEAKGIFWFMWGCPNCPDSKHYYLPCSPNQYDNVKAMSQELGRFSSIFLQDSITGKFDLETEYGIHDSNGGFPIHYRTVKKNGKYYIIMANEAVNENGIGMPVSVNVTYLSDNKILSAKNLRTGEDYEIKGNNNKFTLNFDSLGVALIEVLTSTTTTTTTLSSKKFSSDSIGVHAYLGYAPWYDAERWEDITAKLAGTGADWVRTQILWSNVQPDGPETWNWSIYDEFLSIFNDYNLNIVVTVRFIPLWAVDNECDVADDKKIKACPPENLTYWEIFLTELVNRYGTNGRNYVKYWEIRNEPDLKTDWYGNMTEYYKLLSTAYDTIKEADPNAKILIGGMSGWRKDRIEELLSMPDVGEYFDILNFHIYPRLGTPSEIIEYYQNQLEINNIDKKPIWVTETNPQKSNEEKQIDILKDWYEEIFNAGAEKVFYFSILNWCKGELWGEECDNNVYTMDPPNPGLLYMGNRTETNIYYAYQDMIES